MVIQSFGGHQGNVKVTFSKLVQTIRTENITFLGNTNGFKVSESEFVSDVVTGCSDKSLEDCGKIGLAQGITEGFEMKETGLSLGLRIL